VRARGFGAARTYGDKPGSPPSRSCSSRSSSRSRAASARTCASWFRASVAACPARASASAMAAACSARTWSSSAACARASACASARRRAGQSGGGYAASATSQKPVIFSSGSGELLSSVSSGELCVQSSGAPGSLRGVTWPGGTSETSNTMYGDISPCYGSVLSQSVSAGYGYRTGVNGLVRGGDQTTGRDHRGERLP
jgi:hypothetical protein